MMKLKELESLKLEAEHAVYTFLKDAGWKHTSSSPGCFWVWTREWEGKTLMVDEDLAISMEKSHFHQYEDDSEEDED